VGQVSAASVLGDQSQQDGESYADWQQRRQGAANERLLGPIRSRYRDRAVEAQAEAQEGQQADTRATEMAQEAADKQNQQHEDDVEAQRQAAEAQKAAAREAVVKNRDEAMAAKDEGQVVQRQPDGSYAVQRREDGSAVYEPKSNEPFSWTDPNTGETRWYQDHRDDRGTMTREDLLASGGYHTDAETGERYLMVGGVKQPIGVDENIVKMNQARGQVDAVAAQDAQDDAELRQRKIDLVPMQAQLREAEKTFNPRKEAAQFEQARVTFGPGGPDQWKAAQEQHAAFLAKYGPIQQQVQQAQGAIAALETKRVANARQKAQLLSQVQQWQLARKGVTIPGTDAAGAAGTGTGGQGALSGGNQGVGIGQSRASSRGGQATIGSGNQSGAGVGAAGGGGVAGSGGASSSLGSSTDAAADRQPDFKKMAAVMSETDAEAWKSVFPDVAGSATAENYGQDGGPNLETLIRGAASDPGKAKALVETAAKDNGRGFWGNLESTWALSAYKDIAGGIAGMARWVGMKGEADRWERGSMQAEEAMNSGKEYEGEQVNPSMAGTAATGMAKAAGGITAMIPSMEAGGAIGEGAGIVSKGLPTVLKFIAPKLAGMLPMAVQSAAQASEQARVNAIAQGASEKDADHAGNVAAVKTLPGLGLYFLGGEATGKILGQAGKVLPILKTPFVRFLAGTGLATTMNVGADLAGQAVDGQKPKLTAEGVSQDIAFGLMHGIGEAKAAAYLPTARALVDGSHPELLGLRSMAASEMLPEAAKARAQQQADDLQAGAREFLKHMGEAPGPQQYGDAYQGLLRTREDLKNAASGPDGLAAFNDKLKAQGKPAVKADELPGMIGVAEDQLHRISSQVVPPDPGRADAALKAVGSGMDGGRVLNEMATNPALARASVIVGDRMRNVLPNVADAERALAESGTPGMVQRVRTDQLMGAATMLENLPRVATGQAIEPAIADTLEHAGLVQHDGAGGLKLREDGIPFLPEDLRNAVGANPDRFNVYVSPNGEPGAVAGAMTDAGEDRINRAMGRVFGRDGEPYDVDIRHSTPEGGEPTQTRMRVEAVHPDEARDIAEREIAGRGRDVVESEANRALEPGEKLEPDEARQLFTRAVNAYSEDLAKLGVRGVQHVPEDHEHITNSGGVSMRGDRLFVNFKVLARQLSGKMVEGKSSKDLMEETMNEEVAHALGVQALTREEAEEVARDTAKNAPGMVRAARKAYNGFDKLTDYQKGHELVRMVMTGRYRGTITEAVYKAISKIVTYISKRYESLPETSALKRSVSKMEARADELGIDLRGRKLAEAGEHEVETPAGDARARVAWRVHELKDLVTSDQPGYAKELQPRLRDRRASKNQVYEMARKLNPQRLGESRTSDLGAPITNRDKNVLSGNGRVQAMRLAAREGGAAWERYQEFVKHQAAEHGLSVEGMKEPVLVREAHGYDGTDETGFTKLSNRQQVLGMSQVEQAREDARMMEGGNLLDIFKPGESGDVLTAANHDFNRMFVRGTGDEAALLRGDGSFSPELEGRVWRAVLASLMKGADEETITNAVERAPKLGLNRAINGIMGSAGRLLKLQETDPGMDIAPDLARALRDSIEAKGLMESGKAKTVDDALAQGHLLDQPSDAATLLTRELVQAGSAKQVRDFLNEYARVVEGMVKGPSMFGDEETIKPAELLRSIVDREKLEKERTAAARGLVEAIRAAPRGDDGIKRPARLEEVFGKNYEADAYGMPVMPRTLPDDHELLRPTAREDVGPDGKRHVTFKPTAEVPEDHPLVAKGILKSGTVKRKVLHEAIMQHIIRNATPRNDGLAPVAYLLGGGGGSGKSTVARQLALERGFDLKSAVNIDADEIKKFLPEFIEIKEAGDGRAAATLHEESSYIAKNLTLRITDENRKTRYNVLIDGTMANEGKSKGLIAKLKANGFNTVLFGVTVDPAAGMERAFERAKSSGRWVPSEEIEKAHRGFNAAVKSYLPLVDSAYLWDNTPPEPTEVAKKELGPVDVLNGPEYRLIDERAQWQGRQGEEGESSAGTPGDGAGTEETPHKERDQDEQGDRRSQVRGSGPEGGGDHEAVRGDQVGDEPLAAARRRGDDDTPDLFAKPEIEGAAKDYAEKLRASKPAATRAEVKRTLAADGLGDHADDLFGWLTKTGGGSKSGADERDVRQDDAGKDADGPRGGSGAAGQPGGKREQGAGAGGGEPEASGRGAGADGLGRRAQLAPEDRNHVIADGDVVSAKRSATAGDLGEQGKLAEPGTKENSYREENGQYYQVQDGRLQPAPWLTKRNFGDEDRAEEPISEDEQAKRRAIAAGWMGVRDAAVNLINAETEPGMTNEGLWDLRRRLNGQYDAYVRKNGTLTRAYRYLERAAFLEDDPEYPLLQSLEREKVTYDASGKKKVEYVKADIFSKRVQQPRVMPERAENVADAVNIGMSFEGRLNLPTLARLLGVDEAEAKRQVVESGRAFENPGTGLLESHERYLSGNVRKKLAEAEAAGEWVAIEAD
jgi:predicted ABC-type ATPase